MNQMLAGNVRMSVQEADVLLRNAGYLRGDWDYVKDHHFAEYLYSDILTLDDVKAFLAELDNDNVEHTKPGPFRWGCTKARLIREYLEKDFWRESPSRLRTAIAVNRRICCSCHETGSYKRLDQLPQNHQEFFRRL